MTIAPAPTSQRIQPTLAKILVSIVTLLVIIQLCREGLEWLAFLIVEPTIFSRKMVTMVAMIVLAVLFVAFVRMRKAQLSVFPQHFGKGYVIWTCITLALFLASPSNYINGLPAVLILIYGSIVTPVFEELIFRGYAWNRLGSVCKKEMHVFLITAALFTLWHLGYMVPNILDGNWFAVATKLLAGLCYGLVLGAIRLKTKNCYSTILTHGLLNLFMV